MFKRWWKLRQNPAPVLVDRQFALAKALAEARAELKRIGIKASLLSGWVAWPIPSTRVPWPLERDS